MSDPVAEALKRARASGDWGELLDAIPYVRLLGLEAEATDGDLITRMEGKGALVGNPVLPALHGGTLGALLESAAILKLLWASDSIGVPKTINLTVDYLRSARVEVTRARATITKQGRRVANVRIVAWQQDEAQPIAAAHGHFLLKTASD